MDEEGRRRCICMTIPRRRDADDAWPIASAPRDGAGAWTRSKIAMVEPAAMLLLLAPLLPAAVSSAPAPACTDDAFPQDLDGFQIKWLTPQPAASSLALCRQSCCSQSSCQLWQWAPGTKWNPGLSPPCWTGRYDSEAPPPVKRLGIVSRARNGTVPLPRPPPPPPPLNSSVALSTEGGLGLRFDGIGAISGGGATSKLLIDYPTKQRDEVLDLLFKPGFGASLSLLKVEIGGDGQATEGTESSHMHTPTDEAYDRGYEWWLMKEAQRRNPGLVLYGLPWTFPGWVTTSGKGGTTTNQDLGAIAEVLTEKTADYVARWVDGAQTHHNLTIAFLGLWNEHPPTPDYALYLRAALDRSVSGKATQLVGPDWHFSAGPLVPFLTALVSNASVRAAISRVGFHYPKRGLWTVPSLMEGVTQPVWSSEESSTIDTPAGGACWARLLSQNYVVGKLTASIMWNLVTSFYTSLPYYGASLMNAAEPWSGHYEVMTPIWATAHHTQFTEPGWTYLGHGHGVGTLQGGGTYVTYLAPVTTAAANAGASSVRRGRDWTLVLEKIRASTGPCLRDNYQNESMATETVTIVLEGALRTDAPVQTWRSDWGKGDSVSEADLFQPGPILAVDFNPTTGQHSITLTIAADQVVTATTLLRSAGFGNHPPSTSPPASAPFPDRYANNFEGVALNSEAPFLSDQAGKWEVRAEKSSSKPNQVLSQVCIEQGVVYRASPRSHEVSSHHSYPDCSNLDRFLARYAVPLAEKHATGISPSHWHTGGDRRPISVLGSTLWKAMSVRLRFRLDDSRAQGFVLAVRACNTRGAASCNVKPDDRNQVLPQGTNIQGVYLAFGLDGSVQLANSTYGILAKPRPDLSSRVSLALPSSASASPAPATQTVTSEAVAGAAAWQVTPLVIGQWYNLSVSIASESIGRHGTVISHLNWTISMDSPGRLPASRQIDLPPDGTGGYPMQGQLGLGLVDYGAASIDDLVVEGSSA